MLRTIELALGLAPLNLNDALVVTMFDVFTAQPNFRPFKPLNPANHLSEDDRQLYQNLKSDAQ